jgi:hypothetical protein
VWRLTLQDIRLAVVATGLGWYDTDLEEPKLGEPWLLMKANLLPCRNYDLVAFVVRQAVNGKGFPEMLQGIHVVTPQLRGLDLESSMYIRHAVPWM